jgi:hypothetical protein
VREMPHVIVPARRVGVGLQRGSRGL